MYKFNYQYVGQDDAPIITCIVPTYWLALDLPTLGGVVVYQDKLKPAETLTNFVFEFADVQDASKPGRTFTLEIHLPSKHILIQDNYREVFNKVIRIHYLGDAHITTNDETPAEVVLLNHLLCCFAGSSITGESFLDFADLLQFLAHQTDLRLKYAVGIEPKLMLKNILDGLGDIPSASTYSVIFGKSGSSVSLALFDEVITKLCCWIGYTPAVGQDGFLISVLM